MKTHTIPRLILGLSYVFALSTSYGQQAHNHSHDHGEAHDHSHDHSHSTETLAYRLMDWKEMPFSNSQVAQQHLDAVQSLGCEARMENNAGTVVVSYQCPEWKSMEIASHVLAEQWMAWLMASGFDCSHGHVDAAMLNGPEVVEFRLTEWQTLHAGLDEVQPFVASLSKVGCEVQQTDHGDHVDIRFRSPVWRDIHLVDHQTAEGWIAFFESQQFEVIHEHE